MGEFIYRLKKSVRNSVFKTGTKDVQDEFSWVSSQNTKHTEVDLLGGFQEKAYYTVIIQKQDEKVLDLKFASAKTLDDEVWDWDKVEIWNYPQRVVLNDLTNPNRGSEDISSKSPILKDIQSFIEDVKEDVIEDTQTSFLPYYNSFISNVKDVVKDASSFLKNAASDLVGWVNNWNNKNLLDQNNNPIDIKGKMAFYREKFNISSSKIESWNDVVKEESKIEKGMKKSLSIFSEKIKSSFFNLFKSGNDTGEFKPYEGDSTDMEQGNRGKKVKHATSTEALYDDLYESYFVNSDVVEVPITGISFYSDYNGNCQQTTDL